MISYPNQKIYHIKKRIQEGDIFLMVKWTDYTAAARELSPSALNLYMYLAKNQDNYELYFSSKDYCATFNVVDKTFRNARNELLSKGYLKEGENNHVYFDAQGGYKETKETIKQEIIRLCNKIELKDAIRGEEVKIELSKANLKDIKEEQLYILEGKKIISFLTDVLNEISEQEVLNLL